MDDVLFAIPGAAELCSWFGGFPSFHDAYAEFAIRSDGTGELVADGFATTDKTDERGHHILDKHFRAVFHFEGIAAASFADFLPRRIILFDLTMERRPDDLFRVAWTTSYGAFGEIAAERLRLTFAPGRHGV